MKSDAGSGIAIDDVGKLHAPVCQPRQLALCFPELQLCTVGSRRFRNSDSEKRTDANTVPELAFAASTPDAISIAIEVMRAEGRPMPEQDWVHAARHEEAVAPFASFTFPFLDVPALIRAASVVYQYPMVDRDPLPTWDFGRVTLLGDAASGGHRQLLEAAEGDAFDELLLEEEEDDQQREGGHVRGGQQNGVVREVLALKERDADRQHLHVGFVRDGQRPEELVPRREQGQESERGERRAGQRQVDIPVDLERIGSFELGRFVKIARNPRGNTAGSGRRRTS